MTAAADPVFAARDLVKSYEGGRVQALRGVSFDIAEREFVAIIGKSGSGKSTLLQMLGALDKPTDGELFYRGKKLAAFKDPSVYRAREIGFIFQSFHLLSTFTALENVQIPMFESKRSASARKKRAAELLDLVGLTERMNHLPSQLSGGERQRVAIARSLSNDPTVLLADEPTGNLDSDNAAKILQLISQVQAERQMTLVLITHDMEVARSASRALRMQDGRIIAEGRPGDV